MGKVSPALTTDGDAPYRAAFRAMDAATAIVEVADDVTLIDATERFFATWGLERHGALGRGLQHLFPKLDAARLIHAARRAQVAEASVLTSINSVSPTRSRFFNIAVRAARLSENTVSLTLAAPAPDAGRIALLNDIGAVSGGLIYIYDIVKQRTRHINDNLANLLGVAPGSAVPITALLPLMHSDDIQRVIRHVGEFAKLEDGEVSKFSFRILRRSDATWRWIENRTGVYSRGANGEVRRVVGYAYDVTVPHQTADDLALAANALLNVEAKERRRIARELHDSTAQHVVAADLMIAAHMRRSEASGASDTLPLIRESLSHALREIRTFSFLLHPPRLRDEGLIPVLKVFADGFARRSGLSLKLELAELPARLTPAIELTFFRVAQEAFMNVRRHAQASEVALRLSLSRDEAMLEIEDNGIGVGNPESLNLGVGIDGMRARLSSIGGALSVEDTGHGTLFRARAPAEWVEPNRPEPGYRV